MLKAIIVDGSAVARGLLNTVLTDGGYDVAGQAHTAAAGFALALKHQPHIFCIAREQFEDGRDAIVGRIIDDSDPQAVQTFTRKQAVDALCDGAE